MKSLTTSFIASLATFLTFFGVQSHARDYKTDSHFRARCAGCLAYALRVRISDTPTPTPAPRPDYSPQIPANSRLNVLQRNATQTRNLPRRLQAVCVGADWCGGCKQVKQEIDAVLVPHKWTMGSGDDVHIRYIDSDSREDKQVLRSLGIDMPKSIPYMAVIDQSTNKVLGESYFSQASEREGSNLANWLNTFKTDSIGWKR